MMESGMTRRTLIATASLVAAIAGAGFVAPGRLMAAEMKIISSDVTASFLALGISKSVVIDFPKDIKDVLVADPGIVKAVIRSARRVYIIGASIGQTNVYFYGADGQQLNGLNIAVVLDSQQIELEKDLPPAEMVLVFFGPLVDEQGYGSLTGGVHGFFASLSCTNIKCYDSRRPGADQPPGTQNVNITGSGAGGASVSVGK
jgi:hypothetical protein